MKGSESSTKMAALYEQAYNATYQALPPWKRLDVDTNDGGRIHQEFCKEVIKAAESTPEEFPAGQTDATGFSGKAVPDPHLWD